MEGSIYKGYNEFKKRKRKEMALEQGYFQWGQHKNQTSHKVRLYSCNTAIVGTGAAGYNAADSLWKLGMKDIVIVTENRLAGTSRNTGSDKQTYYKLTLSGSEKDSVREMAKTLYDGKCVDGDIALCEAALSVQCFMKLVELGVPFPRNRYGEYIGYKTDHDPYHRATSVGPYTSRIMTECLEKAVKQDGVPILDKMQVIKILSNGKEISGLLCLDLQSKDKENPFVLIRCTNIIYATGGPAGIYADSVYPYGQYGSTGLALEAGAKGRNLTEWQYGLASISPRWNASGTYMQALPRVFSANPDGTDEKEFLMDFFSDPHEMLSKLFLKGYQWPFDVRKIQDGSSILDILVFLETQKGRKVFLDYRHNPVNGEFSYDKLLPEAREYLLKAGACFGTPVKRLAHMNQPAVDFFLDKGIDLREKPIEIALCAQHNNGGLAVNCWWQTDVEGLFAVGEAAGTHGVYRPGGTALNAGQVGSTRAAQFISKRRKDNICDLDIFHVEAGNALDEMMSLAENCKADIGNVNEFWKNAEKEMSQCGGAIRSVEQIWKYQKKVNELLKCYKQKVKYSNAEEFSMVFRLRDMLISQQAYLFSMLDYVDHGGKSRGSALYTDRYGDKPYDQLSETYRFSLEKDNDPLVQIIWKDGDGFVSEWKETRPIPREDYIFENVWRSFRKNGNIQ